MQGVPEIYVWWRLTHPATNGMTNPLPQAQHALSITLNKLGELHHMRGDLEAALPLYQQSLGIRRQRLAALALQQQQGQPGAAAVAAAREAQQAQQVQEVGEAQQGQQLVEQAEWCAAAVDVAVGCLKVADALQVWSFVRVSSSVCLFLVLPTFEVVGCLRVGRCAAGVCPMFVQTCVWVGDGSG